MAEPKEEIVYLAYEKTELQVLIEKVDQLSLSTPVHEPVNTLLNFLKYTGG
jgi:hypothetical protein